MRAQSTTEERRTMSSSEQEEQNQERTLTLWNLPEVLLFNVVTFVAGPTHRAFVLCEIATLCQASCRILLDDRSQRSITLWDALLKDDYGVPAADHSSSKTTRRSCKRLRRTHIQRVRDAHQLVKDNTEICYFYLAELAHASSKRGDCLTKAQFCGLINEYGPHLRFNQLTKTGGTFLVECCRAQHVRENVILKCVQELVENRAANVNIATRESKQSYMTALCVASARGMPTVAKYLLDHGADIESKSTARFRLFTQRKKTVRCTDSTPLEFARAILAAEQEGGATNRDLSLLNRCILLLERHGQKS